MTKKSREKILAKMLLLIRKNPGIRPRELNRRLNLKHSARLRDTLIRLGIVRKKRNREAVHYYPEKKPG